MFEYNKYNKKLYQSLLKFYENYQENNEQQNLLLLKLCYDILFQENIFIIINHDLKFSLISIINLLNTHYWKNNFFQYSILNQNIIKIFQNILQNINLQHFQINYKIKKEIEIYLQKNNLINNEDIKNHSNVFILGMTNNNFDEIKIRNFFNSYNIDFSKNIININNIQIPNFLKFKTNNIMINHQYEFLHLLFKIYAPYLYYGHIFQESYEYQITNKDIIFDCGSNMGLFAAYCAAQGAQVYCFEPMSYIRDFLQEIKKIYPNNIHIIPYGLSNKNTSTMFFQEINPGASNGFSNMYKSSNAIYKEKCQLITLDYFYQNTQIIPTFIKIDIEGFEEQMLNGAQKIISDNHPIIHLALNHNNNDSYILIPKLQTFNYYQFFNIYEGSSQSLFVLCK